MKLFILQWLKSQVAIEEKVPRFLLPYKSCAFLLLCSIVIIPPEWSEQSERRVKFFQYWWKCSSICLSPPSPHAVLKLEGWNSANIMIEPISPNLSIRFTDFCLGPEICKVKVQRSIIRAQNRLCEWLFHYDSIQ